VYHGEVLRGGKILYRFKYRTIPGIGLILLTTFELYDLDKLDSDDDLDEKKTNYLSSLIEERIAMRSLIGQVVEEKLAQRDAIEQLIKLRISSEMKKEAISPTKAEMEYAPEKEEPKAEGPTKATKLKEFIEGQKRKLEKKEGYTVHLLKGEQVRCPDCKQKLFDGNTMTGCVCYGSDMGRKIFLKKGENGTM